MYLIHNKPQMLRSVTAVDSALPSDAEGMGVLDPENADYALFYIDLTGAATATIDLFVWSKTLATWCAIPSGQATFAATGGKTIRIDNPGGPIFPKVTALGAGGTVKMAAGIQRRKL